MSEMGFIIAAARSGIGKTTATLGIMAALKKRGLKIQPFKAGPDYIDPGHHMAISKRPSYNLDTWMMGRDGVRETFTRAVSSADIGVVEGAMGLYDGRDGKDEAGSTAHLAKLLKLPVILVVDATGMGRSAAALVSGFENFDPEVRVAGIIFNRVGSQRHFQIIRQAVEERCRARVFGYIQRDERLKIPERHLGLLTAGEVEGRSGQLDGSGLAEIIERSVDIDNILRLIPYQNNKDAKLTVKERDGNMRKRSFSSGRVRIAIALDSAFSFYYQENLDILKESGAELVFFSPLTDRRLPADICGIYIGGGYPELYAGKLASNQTMRREIKALAEEGLPIYAECGGLMYLGKELKNLDGRGYEMTNLFPWTSTMLERRKALGYREIAATCDCPFLNEGEKARGHEFHYSQIEKPAESIKRAYLIIDCGRRLEEEGYIYKNTLASYIHLHFASNPLIAERFINNCMAYRRKKVECMQNLV